MKHNKWLAIASVLVLLGVSLPAVARDQSVVVAVVDGSEAPPLRIPDGFFTENAGQVSNEQVRFYSTGGMQAGFAESAVLVKLVERDHSRPLRDFENGMSSPQVQREDIPSSRGVMVRITFPGSKKVTPQGVQEMPHRSNYFIGNDPSGWRTGVRSYREIVYGDLYDGIDLSYSTQDGRLKYEFILDPGADPALIRVSYEGIEGLRLDRAGELIVSTVLGELRDGKPISYQDKKQAECAFVQRGPLSFGFGCEGRDPSRPLVIDPLVYSTFLGGHDFEYGVDIAVDSSGSAYVTGHTSSADFPATPGSFDTTYNVSDAFAAKLDATGGVLVYATFLGGDGVDESLGVAVDSSGNVFVTGDTESTNFPTTPGSFDTTYNGGFNDAFAAKLDASGSVLVYATFLGGGDYDWGRSIAIDSSGSAYVAGHTHSADFPTTPGSFDTTYNGGFNDAFAAKLDATGNTLLYATFLGGGGDNVVLGIAVDSSGSAYVTGHTSSADFPATPSSFDTTHNGGDDAFVAKLNAVGSGLMYATFLGGGDSEMAREIAVDSFGSAYVTGGTSSADFPTTPGSFNTTFTDGAAFVAKLDATGSGLVYSTFLSGGISGMDIAIDSSGSAYVTGVATSADFPVTPGSFDTTYGGTWDAFVAELNAAGSDLAYAMFLGGAQWDHGRGIAVDSFGGAYVTGETLSADFPITTGAFDTTVNDEDVFVTKLNLTSTSPMLMPVLSATGEPNYLSDGLDPETGKAGVTSFVYRVKYTDADNDTPLVGDPRIHIIKGGSEIAGSPATMTFLSWVGAPNNYSTGALYQYSTTLTPCGSDDSYYFSASDRQGEAATWPSPPPDFPDLPCAPVLSATGEPNYLSDGLDPETGAAGVTSFVYRVKYTDADNDTPLAGDPKLHILNGGTEIAGSPFTMTVADPADANYTHGKKYAFATTLSPCGEDYSYHFTASDSTGTPATSWPLSAPNLPDVQCPNRPPVADAGGPYTCRAGEMITLDGSGSTDPGGDVLTYQWTVHLIPVVTLSGQKPTFTCPATEGTFTVNLTVNDSGGLSDTDDSQLSIQPAGGVAVDWTWLIVVAVAVVAVLLILFLLIRRRRRGDETPDTSTTESSRPPKQS